ncbi:hypothetical protein [Candidatus Electronema sp. JM]|uniref:hypothetical protein n=1 Tax=Candidatus Electronema sp. JM TaxID=3401571 RepID=UPI003AA9A742
METAYRKRFRLNQGGAIPPAMPQPAVDRRNAAGGLGRKRFVLDARSAEVSNGSAVCKVSTDGNVSKVSSFSRGESEKAGQEQTAACSSAASGVFSADWETRLMEAVAGSEERERAERFVLKHKPVVGSMIKAGLIGIRKLLELGAPECVIDGLTNEANTSPKEWAEWGQAKETIRKVKELHAARPKAPYLDDQGRLRIPCGCEPKYRWWQDGQSPFETALELGASDEELEHHVNEIFNPDDWRKWQEIKAQRRK